MLKMAFYEMVLGMQVWLLWEVSNLGVVHYFITMKWLSVPQVNCQEF